MCSQQVLHQRDNVFIQICARNKFCINATMYSSRYVLATSFASMRQCIQADKGPQQVLRQRDNVFKQIGACNKFCINGTMY